MINLILIFFVLQKLPVLTSSNKSTSSSRVNLPGDSGSRSGLLAEGEAGGGGAGGLPVLNNNRGELNNDSPTNRHSSARNTSAQTNGHSELLSPQG